MDTIVLIVNGTITVDGVPVPYTGNATLQVNSLAAMLSSYFMAVSTSVQTSASLPSSVSVPSSPVTVTSPVLVNSPIVVNSPVTVTSPVAVSSPALLGLAGAARLLNQGTFGATFDSINSASVLTAAQWVAGQQALPATSMVTLMTNSAAAVNKWSTDPHGAFYTIACQAADQLRQRVAFALSEIFVTAFSPDSGLSPMQPWLWDVFANGAFGNYLTLLTNVTLNPAMGYFLNMWRSVKIAAPGHADENYAREVQQLFSVGLVLLNADGTLQLDANGNPIPTYVQAQIADTARVLTGWASAPDGHTGDSAFLYDNDFSVPMQPYQDYHDTAAKTILSGVQIPANQTALADLTTLLATIAAHPNVGPFIGRQLIQRLVTSNPSAAYVARVSAAWANDGTGTRGNLGAVIAAILTDPEAAASTGPGYGKLREPLVMATHLWRAFNGKTSIGDVYDYYFNQVAYVTTGEEPLYAASVFGNFRPDYSPTGVLKNNGLQGPEFQILNESTLPQTANEFVSHASSLLNSAGAISVGTGRGGTSNVMLQTAEWEPMAANLPELIENLNLVFCAGELSAAAQSTLLTYAKTLPAAQPWSVVGDLAALIIQSPQYAVQQ